VGSDERILVLGFGVNNAALVPYWEQRGALVTVADRREEAQAPGHPHVRWVLGPDYVEEARRLGPYDRVYVTPGIPRGSDVVRRVADGAVVTCETDLFLEQCPAPVLGITGSAGKTTTTTLLGAMLSADGSRRVHVGGNIGRSLLGDLDQIGPGDWVVMELSSFQLELVNRSPHGAAVLNLSENHLDHHPDMADYAGAKARIFAFQEASDWLVTDQDPPPLMADALARHRGGRYTVSLDQAVERGAYAAKGQIWWRAERGQAPRPVQLLEHWRLPGRMNVHNALVATTMALAAGADIQAVGAALKAFRGVPHRLELVAEHGGVRFVNDSIATAPDRTMAALGALEGPLVLLAGGYDKHLDYGPVGRAMAARARVVVLSGPTAPAIRQAVEQAGGARVVMARSFDDAVAAAIQAARPGDTVLLSPASASYDAFRNFEERGERFRSLVRAHVGRAEGSARPVE
jgi:UDP-N-acetylmuramoylalanine--D-glutamate ligase